MNNKKQIILLLASVGTFVEALDIAIINLTIPAIQEQFHISYDTVQWLQTLYVLFFGGFLIIGGKLSDQVGKKTMFIVGGALFLLSSLGAGIAPDFTVLAISRTLQGLGAALLMPASLSIVTQTFTEPQERTRAIGIFSSFAAIGSGSGLSVGGLISTYWSWHWVFLINVPILAITLLFAVRYFPKATGVPQKRANDIPSAILLILGLLFLTFGIHDMANFNERPYLISGCFIATFLLISLLIKRLLTLRDPLITPELFQNRSLVISNLAFFMLGAIFIGFLFLISLMLQNDMGYSAASAGLMLVPFSILSALIAKFVIPTLSRLLSPPKLGILGMLCMFCGLAFLLLSIYFEHPLFLVLSGAACISGIGMTICFTSLSVLGVKNVPQEHYGIAASLTSTSYFLGAGIGLSLVSFLGTPTVAGLAVGPTSVMVLIGYSLFGLSLLGYLTLAEKRKLTKSLKTVEA
ncbi:MFS transporter [Sphingobacterium deserti]|nr:MFS transporter [Sphingobacterium deserti]